MKAGSVGVGGGVSRGLRWVYYPPLTGTRSKDATLWLDQNKGCGLRDLPTGLNKDSDSDVLSVKH